MQTRPTNGANTLITKQKNVKPDKLFDAADSARMLLDVVDSLDETDNGSFFDYARSISRSLLHW